MKDLKVGIVGFGRIAAVHADAWKSVSGVELVSVCDSSVQSLERAGERGLRGYNNLEEMIEREGLDAVSICTPPDSHASQALTAMEYGVNVLCEKPLTPKAASTRQVLEAAQESGVHLQMATKFRHVPAIQFAKSLMEEGEIGDIEEFQIEFAGAVDMINRWNSTPSISGGGVIIDNGSHALDLINYLFGGLKRVQALHIQPIQQLPVEDQAMLLVETATGVVGDVMLSWSVPSQSDTYLRIQGSKGDISIGWKAAFVQMKGKKEVKIANGSFDKNLAHANMMESFRDLINGTGTGWLTEQEIMVNATAIEACYRSIQAAKWAEIGMFASVAA